MARFNAYTYPLDVPAIESRTLRYREADAPGNASHMAVEPWEPLRAEKGDLGVPPQMPRALSSGSALPMKNIIGETRDYQLRGRGPWKGG
jgi:hypothetical protein